MRNSSVDKWIRRCWLGAAVAVTWFCIVFFFFWWVITQATEDYIILGVLTPIGLAIGAGVTFLAWTDWPRDK